VRTYEPFVPGAHVPGAVPQASLESALEDAEALVLLVDHRGFREIDPQRLSQDMPGRIAIDTRGVWGQEMWEAAGFDLYVLGVGGADA
jgi:UDP-N-acetyl-D-mannosaminuronic acid dehydrogenase